LSGKRTAILRSERCLEAVCVNWTMGWVLFSGRRTAAGHRGASAFEEGFHLLDNLCGRSRRMYDSSKLAAVPHAMGKPARELFHFANTIGQVGSANLSIVARK
jgi:hypothetical protein